MTFIRNVKLYENCVTEILTVQEILSYHQGMYITDKCSSHLQRLNKEDTLKEGNNHGYQPTYGARFSKFQAIQHCEIA